MSQLRTAFLVDDDLQAYAVAFLFERPGALAAALGMRDAGAAQVATLARDGRYQVELCVLPGGVEIPRHVHPHADTVEVALAGAVRLVVNGVDPFASITDDRLPRFVRGRGIRINASDTHGGAVLPGGAMFLSIQRWRKVPQSVLTDYVGVPLSGPHRELMKASACN